MKKLFNWKYLLKLIVLIGLIRAIMFFISNFESTHDVCLQIEEKWKTKELNGKLISKFIDSAQHNYKTALFIQKNDSIKWVLDWDESNLYSILTVGDSIIKKEEQLKVKIYRGEKIFYHDLNFKCESFK